VKYAGGKTEPKTRLRLADMVEGIAVKTRSIWMHRAGDARELSPLQAVAAYIVVSRYREVVRLSLSMLSRGSRIAVSRDLHK
jgi:hypothetical protein